MKIEIPYAGREGRVALADCIDYAAERSKITDERGLVFLTFFLERLVDNVCAGRVVSLPAVGKFGPWLEERPLKLARHNSGYPYCVPVFVAARSFRRQCRLTAPISSSAKSALKSFRRNHTRTGGAEAAPPYTTMARIRASIANQSAVR